MLQPIVEMRECDAGVVRRGDEHALHLACKLCLQGFQRQQVVAPGEPVVKQIVVRHPLLRVVTPFRVFQLDARLQPRALVFVDLGEF